ncbi:MULTISPECIES: vitamin K epoxide reductase family protein [unclassified Arthrobacter]|uniref:vitamin K epoxide reductase family protein n=1 Tax=unclassified Arthrobacter TaxID=235627 RepID=UPI00159E4C13|nr:MULTISPECIES: vitamin K epoxide reductase family protein [unclassified Arthrobacter]MCQ9163877.1 vitamin K epoxide reductase family protein [Arthrobacter sp. STN4]NVM98462.1 vitamin K epoxide reductase family protein [Arthrobacter sp. SDTb3-6]
MPSPSVSARPADAALVGARPFGWFLVIAGAVAWLASAALVLDRLKLYANPHAVLNCDVNSWISCGDVMKTPQAAIFGFPNPFIGIVAFAVVITTGMVLLAGARLARWYWICFNVGVALGLVLVCWFFTQAVYVLALLCPYCMVVWAMVIPVFVWVTVRNLRHGVIPAAPAVARFAADWAWVITALAYLGIIAAIFFKFMHVIIPSNA